MVASVYVDIEREIDETAKYLVANIHKEIAKEEIALDITAKSLVASVYVDIKRNIDETTKYLVGNVHTDIASQEVALDITKKSLVANVYVDIEREIDETAKYLVRNVHEKIASQEVALDITGKSLKRKKNQKRKKELIEAKTCQQIIFDNIIDGKQMEKLTNIESEINTALGQFTIQKMHEDLRQTSFPFAVNGNGFKL